MTADRIDGYASALFEIAKAEGNLDEVEDELFRFARSLEGSDELRNALTDELVPAERRQAIVEDLLGPKASHHDGVARSASSSAPGGGRDLPAIIAKLVERAAAEKDRTVAEVRSAIPLTADQQHRLAAALANATGKQVEVKVVVDPSVLGGVVATVGDTVIDGSVRTRLDQIQVASRRETLRMAELTISTADITAALKKHLEGFEPSLEAAHRRSRHRGRRRHRPCVRAPGVRRQRAAGVRGRHRRARPEPGRGLDRRRRARRGRRHRRGPDGEVDRAHPVGARRRRPAQPGGERPRRAGRRPGPDHRRHHPPGRDPGAVDHGPQARGRADADRHQGHRRDDAHRPWPARAHHRRPQDGQDHRRHRHDPEPEGSGREVHLRGHRPEAARPSPRRWRRCASTAPWSTRSS